MRQHLLTFLLILVSTLAYSGEGVWSKRIALTSVSSDLVTSSSNAFYSLSSVYSSAVDLTDYSKKEAFVFLDFSRKNQSELKNFPVWRLNVKFEYLNGSNVLEQKDLNINFDASLSSVYSDYIKLNLPKSISSFSINVKSIKAEYLTGTNTWVQETNISPSSTKIPSDIDLRLELREELYYQLGVESPLIEQNNLNFDPLTFRANWNYLQGAEEYDFEWVFLDSKSIEYTQVLLAFSSLTQLQSGAHSLPFDLKEPSRVRLRGTNYTIDNVFPTGRLFFRVRPVSKFTSSSSVSDDIKLGEWSYFASSSAYQSGNISLSNIVYYEIGIGNSFERTKNWLYGVAYAEGGKSVSSVSFYDGGNKGRQSLTYNTSDNVTLVSETKYDREVRATINVVPAPIKGRKLGYKSNFNLATNGQVFDYDHFDIDAPEPMLSPSVGESGSAQYFSSNNQFTDDLFRSAIPEANGYVYSQTLYRNDGSGRIERIGGIGETFKATGDHAVQTFYGTPTELELKRLFGNNISNDLNGYRKEMVRDANGQYSVTYYDKRGHVIATGLSGNAPSNLFELEGSAPTIITSELNNNNVLVDPFTVVSDNTFLNGILNNNVQISYNIQGAINQINTPYVSIGGTYVNLGQPLCSGCKYDLKIEVKDVNGIDLPNTPFIKDDIDPAGCTAANYTMPTLNITLPTIGEYRIIKTLRVDQSSMATDFNTMLSNAIANTNMQSNFVSSYLQNVDFSACYTNCSDYCLAAAEQEYNSINGAGAWDLLTEEGRNAQQSLINKCMSENCNSDELYESFADASDLSLQSQDLCYNLKAQMLHQISPGGVFFDDPNSVFWQTLSNSGVTSITVGGTSYAISDIKYQTVAWNPDFANALIIYHREYCHLSNCSIWENSTEYSTKLKNVILNSTWSSTSSMFTNPYSTGVTGFAQDPFLTSIYNVAPTLQTRISTFLSNQQLLNGPLSCNGPQNYFSTQPGNHLIDYVNALVNCVVYQNSQQVPAVVLTSAQIDLMKRQLFSSIYDNIKETMIKSYKTSQFPPCLYYSDENAVFPSVKNLTEIQQATTTDLSLLSYTQDCSQMAISNVTTWLDQISTSCLDYLASINKYNSTFSSQDLTSGLNPNNIEQLFYQFSLLSCQNNYNTNGLFYDVPTGNAAAHQKYLAIQSLLSTTGCSGQWPLPFEITPAPGINIVNITNTTASTTDLKNKLELLVDIANIKMNQFSTELSTNDGTRTYSSPAIILGGGFGGKYNATLTRVTPPPHGSVTWNYVLSLELSKDGCKYSNQILLSSAGLYSIDVTSVNLTSNNFNAIYNVTCNQTNFANFSGVSSPITCSQSVIFSSFESLNVPVPDQTEDCIQSELSQATIDANLLFQDYIHSNNVLFASQTYNCLKNITENLTLTYSLKEYQYTLYYYDLAGNLVQTVPPQGVMVLTPAQVSSLSPSSTLPDHSMETRYLYNGLNSLIAQYTPDGGKTTFILDKLYRVRFSQNARQVPEHKASYSKYDELGRIIEAGETNQPNYLVTDLNGVTTTQYTSLNTPSLIEDNTFPASNWKLDYTITYYEGVFPNDQTSNTIASKFVNGQENLRNAIGAIAHYQLVDETNKVYTTNVISYSYDAHKNVNQIVSTNYQLAQLQQQHSVVEYSYDLISGNVNSVIYQRGKMDEFRHKYHYDANNRIVRFYTSKNGEIWERDAKYFYYLHGALARTELGQDQVQGIDYAYNLQGWIKGVNSSTLDKSRDLGKDAFSSASNGDNQFFGVDAFGYNLNYYQGDYNPIANNSALALAFANTDVLSIGNGAFGSLYNGNITHMVSAIRKTDESLLDILGNNYRYDQLQRINSMLVYNAQNIQVNNSFAGASLYRNGAYKETYSFDKNGNLKTLTRNGSGRNASGATIGLQMDNFTYNYYNTASNASASSITPTGTNRLSYVSDDLATLDYSSDIEPGQLNSNYQYDATGQLIKDVQEGIDKIEWTVTGKVKRIKYTAAAKTTLGRKDLEFIYNAMDMRIAKIVYNNDAHSDITATYYTFDAQGNVMATYTRNEKELGTSTTYTTDYLLNEHHIYGSSRIGVENENVLLSNRKQCYTTAVFNLTTGYTAGGVLVGATTCAENGVFPSTYDFTNRIVGDKNYELSNHLGNVLVVITDRKVGYDDGTYSAVFGTKTSATIDGVYDFYTADVVQYSDYSPYGVQLDGRFGSGGYKYGYQGSEMDNEIKGNGNSYTTEFRMLDPRLGRWLSIDPLSAKYPGMSPYNSMNNNPIISNDVKGDSPTDWGFNKKTGEYKWYNSESEAKSDLGGDFGGYFKPGHVYQSVNVNEAGEKMNVELGKGKGKWNYTTKNANGQSVTQQGMPIDEGYSDQFAEQIQRDAYFKQFNSMIDNGAMQFFQIMTLPLSFELAGAGGMTFGSLTAEVSTQYVTTSVTKTFIDGAAQVSIKGYKNLDLIDAIGTGFLTPAYSATFGGAIDYLPFDNNKVQIVGVNKSYYKAALDTGLKYTFSSQGYIGKYMGTSYPLGNAINKYVPQYTPILNAPLSAGGKYVSKTLTELLFIK